MVGFMDEETMLKYASEGMRNAAYWFEQLSQSKSERRTIAKDTRSADIPGSPLDAVESTTPMTPPSSQSDTSEQQSGRAEPSSECAHSNRMIVGSRPIPPLPHMVNPHIKENWWCKSCGALMFQGQILVPAAPTG